MELTTVCKHQNDVGLIQGAAYRFLEYKLKARVYLWQIHVDIWQNQFNIVKLKNKIKLKNLKK